MKRLISALCVLAAAGGLVSAPALAYEPGAKSYALYEPVTGTFIAEKNADDPMLIASATKIMTALVVLENCELSEKVEITDAHTRVEGSSMYLRAGGEYSVEDLLYGLLLASGNDAALALAEHTAGSVEAFAALMNAECARLGLENSHFENPHGLDGEEHYSSARDLALLTAAALVNEDFRRIFSTRTYSVNGISYTNHNKLLGSFEGCIGGKTGYTKRAGRVLVTAAERDGMTLIFVTISDPSDWEDHRKMLDAAFEDYSFVPLPAGKWRSVPIISGIADSAPLKCSADGLLVERGSAVEMHVVLPRFVFAPVLEGDLAGSAQVFVDGRPALDCDILYASSVPLDGSVLLTPLERFRRDWYAAMSAGPYFFPMY